MTTGYNRAQPTSTPRLYDVNGCYWLYGLSVGKDRDFVAFNSEWLRDMRDRLGLSAEAIADMTRVVAKQYGDPIKLPQQLVSKFERGLMKSTPRWLGYAQIAIAKHINLMQLPAGRLWELRLPRELKEYLQDRQRLLNNDLLDQDDGLTPEENEWIDLLQNLDRVSRDAVLQLARTLGGGRRARATEDEPTIPVLQDKVLTYRGQA